MSERTKFMVWVTKYALTDGIMKMQVEDCFNIDPDMVRKINGPQQCFHGKDWHRTPELAVVRAKEMQSAKLKSIDKQRAKIVALDFDKVLQ
jgi:hypothetical protein